MGHKEVVDLLISKLAYYQHCSICTKSIESAEWRRHVDLLQFMINDYRAFHEEIRTLLVGDSHSSTLSAPFVVELHPCFPTLDLGVVSSIYLLEFDTAPLADAKTGLRIDIQQCRYNFMEATEKLDECDRFLGMDDYWIEEHQQTSQLPSLLSKTHSSPQMDQATQTPCTKLLLITEWASPTGETRLLANADPPIAFGNRTTTAGEYFANNVLRKASRYTKHHVMFENIDMGNVGWLDKDEKWSVYVARLMADADKRMHNSSSA